MATKDEFYHKIIAAQQAEIDSLKAGLAEVRKEIESLKANVSPQPVVSKKEPTKDDIQVFFTRVANVCNETIQKELYKLPDWFVEKQKFEDYCKSAETRFVPADTFSAYQKSNEKRLKSIENRLGKGFCILAINLYEQKRDKGYRSFLSGLKHLKDIEFEGLLPLLGFLGVALFAVWLISTIKW